MSLGSKKSNNSKAVKISAPAQIKAVEFNTPTGDRFISKTVGKNQVFESLLSPQTQGTVQEGLSGLKNLAKELNQPDAARLQSINQRANDLYALQAGGIEADFDEASQRTRSDLSKRFGGAYNATFGTDLLARLEGNRVSQLSDARKQAALLAEDLYQNDENSRAQRFTLFSNYLNSVNNQAMGLAGEGFAVLGNERQRSSELALQRAQLAGQMARFDAEQQARNDQLEARRRVEIAQAMAQIAAAGA